MSDKKGTLKIIVSILSILLLVSSFLLYENYEKIKLQNETISNLIDFSEDQKIRINELETTINSLRTNLSETEELLENETRTRQGLEKEIINLTMVARSDYMVLAVDDTNRGHVIELELIIKDGKGHLFLNVANVFIDETLQSSAQLAVRVAREITRTSLIDKDVLININAPIQQGGLIISGGSAGASITLAAIAAMQNSSLRNDVYITGTINLDHTIGKIGGARAKALAAKENGAVIFLVPAGQKIEVGEVGIEVIEVRTIEEAAEYARS